MGANEWIFLGCVAALLATVIAGLSYSIGYDAAEKETRRVWKSAAVSLGFGSWVVKADGSTTFSWKTANEVVNERTRANAVCAGPVESNHKPKTKAKSR